MVSYSDLLSYTTATALDSGSPSGVHPDCQGTTDVLKDLFLANKDPKFNRVTFGDTAFGLSGQNTGMVGIVEITFTATSAGTEEISLTNLNLQVFGTGVPTPPVLHVQPLVVQ
jgi:hypothetical protein